MFKIKNIGKFSFLTFHRKDRPLPPLEIQREIVEKIEAERKAVNSCRELAILYEEKIRQIVEKVWG